MTFLNRKSCCFAVVNIDGNISRDNNNISDNTDTNSYNNNIDNNNISNIANINSTNNISNIDNNFSSDININNNNNISSSDNIVTSEQIFSTELQRTIGRSAVDDHEYDNQQIAGYQLFPGLRSL